MTFQSFDIEAGLTQAARVKAFDRWSEVESGIVTLSLMPSKYNALPSRPVVHSGPFTNVPLFPLPDESQAVLPVPSSNFQWPTRPDAVSVGVLVGVGDVVAVTSSVRLLGAAGMGAEHCEKASDRPMIDEIKKTSKKMSCLGIEPAM
jgi:hypothetical protein